MLRHHLASAFVVNHAVVNVYVSKHQRMGINRGIYSVQAVVVIRISAEFIHRPEYWKSRNDPEAPDVGVGDDPALDWNIGAPMDCIAADEWIWSTDKAERDFACKFLINDETWSVPEDIPIKAGQKTVCLPKFR
ncbi:MAG: hypothetical protein IID18_01070 [Nitrospinae bacterium]|nr:hypothetical protein [Nitrospinota bacterium]